MGLRTRRVWSVSPSNRPSPMSAGPARPSRSRVGHPAVKGCWSKSPMSSRQPFMSSLAEACVRMGSINGDLGNNSSRKCFVVFVWYGRKNVILQIQILRRWIKTTCNLLVTWLCSAVLRVLQLSVSAIPYSLQGSL